MDHKEYKDAFDEAIRLAEWARSTPAEKAGAVERLRALADVRLDWVDVVPRDVPAGTSVDLATRSYEVFGSGAASARAIVVEGEVALGPEVDLGDNGFVGYCQRTHAGAPGALVAYKKSAYPGGVARGFVRWV